MTEALFEGYPDPEPIDPATTPRLSADRRRTIGARDKIANGIHPATGLRLADNGHKCGDCAHLKHVRVNKTYLKCDLRPDTAGPGTDIRAWWPACTKWEPES